jgi:hypothetical protein
MTEDAVNASITDLDISLDGLSDYKDAFFKLRNKFIYVVDDISHAKTITSNEEKI